LTSGVKTANVLVPPPVDVSAKLAVVANELDIALRAQLLVPNSDPVIPADAEMRPVTFSNVHQRSNYFPRRHLVHFHSM